MTTISVLTYMTLLLIKHSIGDLNLQGRIPGDETSKLSLISRKNTIHSLDHAGLGLLCSIWFAPLWLAILLAVAEFFAHYAIDHLKSRIRFAMNIGLKDRLFWHLQGIDQIMHTLTYVAMTLIVMAWNASI